MNVLTFDIEEWYLEKRNKGNRHEKIALYDRLLNEILDLLDEMSLKATFFCVGGMVDGFSHVVRLIDQRGHEIGCHSYCHIWLNKMSHEEVLQDTKDAVNSLEQCIGKKVISYRAPAFSIGENNKWAFEILAECGIKRDASVFPSGRDFGGFPNFGHKTPVTISCDGITLKEFPICTTRVLGKEFAYSGGGYFRFFPLWFVKRELEKSDYAMCYFHLGDLIPETSKMMSREAYETYFKEKGTYLNRYKRRIKSNLGKKNAFDKVKALIRATSFCDLSDVDDSINWKLTPKIEL